MDFEAKLQEFGLSGKEARVYVALLELAEASASNIAQKSGVKRATTYVVLDSLKEMGLVSTYNQDGTTQYVASSPDTLKKIVEDKKSKWSKKRDELDSFLPELQSLHNTEASKPAIRFFEGEESLFTSYNDFLSSSPNNNDESIKYFFSRDKLQDVMDKEKLDNFAELRHKKGLEAEVIYNLPGRKIKNLTNTEAIKVGQNKFPISIDLEIYGDSVFISTLEEPLSAILIKNQSVANSLKTMFKLAQIGAETEQKNGNDD